MTLCNIIALGILVAFLIAFSLIMHSTYEQKYQTKWAQAESEFAAWEASIAEREQKVAKQEIALIARETVVEEREKNVAQQEYKVQAADLRSQEASEKSRKAEALKCDLERQAHALEQMKQSFLQDSEEIIARRVADGIKGREKGLDDCFKIIKRKFRVIYNRETEMLKRAVLIANYLGVSWKCILTRREKKIVNEHSGEFTKERQALIDLVMSCPDDQTKALLSAMQQYPRNRKQ